jgi:SAM-dependent methyltransferase
MAAPELPHLSAKMKADWDARAREDARFYIAADDFRSEEAFEASGQRDAALLTRGLEGFLRPHMRVLEIGCGIGRLLRVLAPRFREVHGVDVSGEMVRRGRERLRGCGNVFLHETSGVDLRAFAPRSFDFVYSYVTFQHVPEAVVAAYCREAARVLARGGRFRFQVLSYERLDGAHVEPAADDTFTLRSLSDPDLARMLADARLEPLSRLELQAPDGVVPGYRGRHIWMTCRPRSRLKPRWLRRTPTVEVGRLPTGGAGSGQHPAQDGRAPAAT